VSGRSARIEWLSPAADLIVFGARPPEIPQDNKLERDPGTTQRLCALAGPNSRDVFVMTPQFEINGCVVELALPDNGAPYGALLPLPGGGSVCAVSSVTYAPLAQLVVAEVGRRMEAAGQVPPVYLSANVPGGDEHNITLESRYAGRIRRTA
jgi:hypothetical protein